MPLDIQDFREYQGGDIEKLKESQRRRFADVGQIDLIIELDQKWRKALFDLDSTRCEISKLKKEIGNLRKNKKDASDFENKLKIMKSDIKTKEICVEKMVEERNKELKNIGNYVHDSVPVSKSEEDNQICRKQGQHIIDERKNIASGLNIQNNCTEEFNMSEQCNNTDKAFKLLHHHDLLYRIGGYEPRAGAEVAGHRGYYLKGPGVILNMALQRYGIDFLSSDQYKYEPIQPPYFMKRDVMKDTAQLNQFDEELYHVGDGLEEERKYLIATSEQPISALHRKEQIKPSLLPIRYAGISTCFRKEAGAHGKDAQGIYRVHQFEKIEQFVYCAPEESWKMHEEMIEIAENFYKTLELPYQIVNIVSGELNNAASKKYDLEAWFPTLEVYRELVSCSNCTDYQARSMETRFGTKKLDNREKNFVHMLNSTLCATTRTICCILENYQTANGVIIPKVLQPYCGNRKFFPFIRPAIKTSTSKQKNTPKTSTNLNNMNKKAKDQNKKALGQQDENKKSATNTKKAY